MKKTLGIAAVLLSLVAFDTRGAAQQTPDWGSGVAPFAFALIGDMPYGADQRSAVRQTCRRNQSRQRRRFRDARGRYQGGQRALRRQSHPASVRPVPELPAGVRVYARDNEWTDCHRVNNGQYNPLERLAFVRSVFFPEVGHTTGGQVRPVRSQAEGSAYPEFVENVMFTKQSVMFATVHVVGSNNDLEPGGHSPLPTAAVRRGPIASPNSNGVRQPRWRGWTRSSRPRPARRGCSC